MWRETMRESCGILFADAKKVLLNFESIEKKKNLIGINFQHSIFFRWYTELV